jgi:hypothetical protein
MGRIGEANGYSALGKIAVYGDGVFEEMAKAQNLVKAISGRRPRRWEYWRMSP